MSVRETLELDISEALSEVTRLGSQLDNVAKAFGETLNAAINEALENIPIIRMTADSSEVTTSIDEAVAEADDVVPVSADATEVTSEIDAAVSDADGTIPVTADASEVTSEIDAAVEEAADSIDVTVDVNVDTAQAQSAIDDLSGSLDGAGAAGEAASGGLASAAVAGAALNKTFGNAGALGKAGTFITALGPAGAAAAAGIGAATAASGFLYGAAFEAVAVTQQWENSLGDLGARIMDLEGGATGFSGTLASLAQDVGSSDEAVLLATQRYVSFQQAAGLADDEIVENTQNLAALAAQIRVNNPALGTMDQIITALSRGLQRGGPRMQAYGLALNATDIEARALSNSGKTLAAELTNADKSAAGLDLAMQQLAPSQAKVTEGMENVAVKSDRAGEKFGDALEVLGEATVEPITEGMLLLSQAFEGVVAAVAPVLVSIGEDLAAAFRLASEAVGPIIRGLDIVQQVLLKTGISGEDAAEGIDVGDTALEAFGRTVVGTVPVLGPVANLMLGIGDAASSQAGAVDEAAVATARAAQAEANTLALRSSGWYEFLTTTSVNQQSWVAAVEANTARASAAFGTFLDAATANIPSVTAEFDKLAADMGTDQVLANLETMFAATETWTASMEAQIALGNTNIVTLMAQLGPEKSAILLGSYSGDEAELEAHLARMFEAEQNARLQARQATVMHYLIAQGMTKEGAERVVAQLGNSLLLEEPTLEAVQAAEAVVAASDLETIAARVTRNTVEAARVEAARMKQVGEDLMEGLLTGFRSRGGTLAGEGSWAVKTIYDAAMLRAQSTSPSKLFASLGKDLANGLVVGMDSGASLLTASGASMVSVAAAPVSAFTASVQNDPTLAGANISVTVPVTVTAGMTADDGRRIGEAAGQAAEMELRRVYRMEAMLA